MRRYLKPGLTALAIVATTAWVVPTALIVGMQRTMIFQSYFASTWFGDPVAPRDARLVTYRTADGETVSAIWKPPAPGGRVVLTFHGNAGSPMPHADRFMAPPWSENGWGFLAPALRGYPGSSGRPGEEGMLLDAEAAWEFVRENAPDAGILVHGHSLGAASAVMVAAAHDIEGAYLESPFASVASLAYDRAWWMPRPLVDAVLRDPIRSDVRMRSVTEPVFVVHGGEDPLIPAGQSEIVAAEAAGTVVRKVDEGLGHSSVFGLHDVEAERMFSRRRGS